MGQTVLWTPKYQERKDYFSMNRESKWIVGPLNQTVSLKMFLGPNEHLMDLLELPHDDGRLPDLIHEYFNIIWFYAIWLVEIIVKETWRWWPVKWAKKKISVQKFVFSRIVPSWSPWLDSSASVQGHPNRTNPSGHPWLLIISNLCTLTSIAL